ncbi:DUF4174 domain-containing protein [Candidatus Bathyarchaeota archaeon]|nr:DUF4174 domain-containing protein [Candidatus Bathyarchaeota archaeon]
MLEEYRWKNRILIVLSQDPDKVKAQKKLLDKVIPLVRERKLLLIGFNITQEPYTTHELTQLKTKYQDKQDHVILFGLDGQPKNSWNIPVNPEKIFKEIDKMPMRQRELKEKN